MTRPFITDVFMANDELELLQMRLEEMYDAVDAFIAVEADVDHQDHPKPYHITENAHLFDAWKDKLYIVRATGLPTHADDPDPWARELAQREYAVEGLREIARRHDFLTSDIILHGDLDEICRPLHIRNVHAALQHYGTFVTFEQDLHCFAVDWLHPDPWGGTVAATLRQMDALGALKFQKLRNTRNSNPALPKSGWHFSWLGGRDRALKKLGSFCHPEIAERTLVGLESDRYLTEGLHVDGRRMTPVEVDDTFPAYIRERRCPATWWRPR